MPSRPIHGPVVLLRTLGLCVLLAAVLTIPFTVAERTTSQVLFVGALAIAVPTFIAIQRGWTALGPTEAGQRNAVVASYT